MRKSHDIGMHITEVAGTPRHAGLVEEGWSEVHQCVRPSGARKYIFQQQGQSPGTCHVCQEGYTL